MLATAFACLAFLSATLMIWQWVAAVRFPLHQRNPEVRTSLPSISILKPVTGADSGTAEALESWLNQAYPGSVEILFGVGSPNDPAFPLVRQLLDRNPNAPARLILCPHHPALNRKVGKLIHLAHVATGQILVVSDADVSAPTDLLTQAVPLLDIPSVGLVHCLYRIANAPTLATRWEAFVVNVDFWSQVLQNQTLKPIDYALGAVMIFRRQTLAQLGGFESLANVLADDNRLGRRIVEQGFRTEFCPVVVDCRAAPADWLSVWRHQLRWAITIRVCQPGPYFLSILANGTLWPFLWAAAGRSPIVMAIAAALIALRMIQAISLQSRFTQNPHDWTSAWLAPLKDMLQVALWASAFLHQEVVWRGARFRIGPDGQLRPSDAPDATTPVVPPSPAQNALSSSGFGIPPQNR